MVMVMVMVTVPLALDPAAAIPNEASALIPPPIAMVVVMMVAEVLDLFDFRLVCPLCIIGREPSGGVVDGPQQFSVAGCRRNRVGLRRKAGGGEHGGGQHCGRFLHDLGISITLGFDRKSHEPNSGKTRRVPSQGQPTPLRLDAIFRRPPPLGTRSRSTRGRQDRPAMYAQVCNGSWSCENDGAFRRLRKSYFGLLLPALIGQSRSVLLVWSLAISSPQTPQFKLKSSRLVRDILCYDASVSASTWPTIRIGF